MHSRLLLRREGRGVSVQRVFAFIREKCHVKASPRFWLVRYSLLEASTRSTTVLVEQFYACQLKSTADSRCVCKSHCSPSVACFRTTDR
jgi:hypothetical protein